MQDQNYRKQDRLTLKLTTLIFLLCFLGPLIYSAVTGKCFLKTCALKLDSLKNYVAEKGAESFICPFSKKSEPAKSSVSGVISPISVRAEKPAPQPAAAASPDTASAPVSPTAAIDENQKKTFNISG